MANYTIFFIYLICIHFVLKKPFPISIFQFLTIATYFKKLFIRYFCTFKKQPIGVILCFSEFVHDVSTPAVCQNLCRQELGSFLGTCLRICSYFLNISYVKQNVRLSPSTIYCRGNSYIFIRILY